MGRWGALCPNASESTDRLYTLSPVATVERIPAPLIERKHERPNRAQRRMKSVCDCPQCTTELEGTALPSLPTWRAGSDGDRIGAAPLDCRSRMKRVLSERNLRRALSPPRRGQGRTCSLTAPRYNVKVTGTLRQGAARCTISNGTVRLLAATCPSRPTC